MLSCLSKRELHEICKSDKRKFRGYSKLGKSKLIEFINERQSQSSPLEVNRYLIKQKKLINKQKRIIENQKSLIQESNYILADVTEIYQNEIAKLKKGYSKVRDCPFHLVQEFIELSDKLNTKFQCIICYSDLDKKNCIITTCGHKYCKECRGKITKCALCGK